MSDAPRRTDAELFAQIREVLDGAALEPDVAARLAAARRRAVARMNTEIAHAPSRWLPAGALATTLLAIGIGVAIDHGAPPSLDEQQIATVEDLDLLMDLEFVAWLDSDNVDAG